MVTRGVRLFTLLTWRFLIVASLLAPLGCAALMGKRTPPPAEKVTVSYKLPQITPMPESKETVTNGAVTMSLSTNTYSAEPSFTKSYKQLPAAIVSFNSSKEDAAKRDYEVRKTPDYKIVPEQFTIKIRVVNNGDKVLQLAGSLLRFNVDGKEVSIEGEEVKAFLQGVLAPREQKEFEITGPSISTLPDSANIVVSVYGVITATDAAGNASERSNFEWFYKYEVEQVSRQEDVRINTERLNPSQVPSN